MWKHCVLVAALAPLAREGRRLAYIETHAGEGRYWLGATGEWTEGLGKLWPLGGGASGSGVVDRYLDVCRALNTGLARPARVPGSPAVAAALLGPADVLQLWDREHAVAKMLEDVFIGDGRVTVREADGVAAMADAVRAAEASGRDAFVLVDPPFNAKSDWTAIPDAIIAAAQASPRARFLLWYPVKSLTRPNAMLARFAERGVAGAVAELVTTPLELQRNRLNGSGVIGVGMPAPVWSEVAAAAPVVGARCATHPAGWSLRLKAWGV